MSGFCREKGVVFPKKRACVCGNFVCFGGMEKQNNARQSDIDEAKCYVKNHADHGNFRDGSLWLSIGDEGMGTDLVFAMGAMEEGDPRLERQRILLRAVVEILTS